MSGLPLEALSEWLLSRLGSQVHRAVPVGGGCIHQAWRLSCADGRTLFAKSNRAGALPMLEAEATGLEALATWSPPELLVPLPLACGVVGDRAVLVLPWLSLQGGGAGWALLGRGLARLHRNSLGGHAGCGFGFPADNFIGSAPQANGWRPCWADFFAECRLAPQFAMAAARGEPCSGAAAVMEGARRLLRDHACDPVLVHGDLWTGNAGVMENAAALFDPACYWGDREVDLAMAKLFGGFPDEFFTAYQAEWPLPAGTQPRMELYNLYHLLNHANLFGGGYRRQAEASMARLRAIGGGGGGAG
ncbi:fructosamine kinase family protein [Cyanobium sp. NIES-981]|uniref:fructosamine kinase family protein n=1 Tax=Cyanobium sp. NIES-981 TaxID=1851505 RepID=UPI0007DDEC32|nr:fructosamine kinase family protein [Cyanobium sp. NIES-981]SBO43540.1 conserved protein of unknown function [Cyanobium sp. NIES-981]